jgi:hypothetical protein
VWIQVDPRTLLQQDHLSSSGNPFSDGVPSTSTSFSGGRWQAPSVFEWLHVVVGSANKFDLAERQKSFALQQRVRNVRQRVITGFLVQDSSFVSPSAGSGA